MNTIDKFSDFVNHTIGLLAKVRIVRFIYINIKCVLTYILKNHYLTIEDYSLSIFLLFLQTELKGNLFRFTVDNT